MNTATPLFSLRPPRLTPALTHESFVHAVRALALEFAAHASDHGVEPLTQAGFERAAGAKLVYGRGMTGLRGITQFQAWKHEHPDHHELIEICALGEESWVQLAGSTIHELAHAAAGPGAGHGKLWRQACASLGLRRIKAAGTVYNLANFAPWVRERLWLLPKPADGNPNNTLQFGTQLLTFKQRPCSHGVGSRGGKSRGIGSGSRLRKYICDHGQIIRASTDSLDCTCNVCSSKFVLA